MTVWRRRTWLSTLPSEYFVSSRPAASSTASEMAMPRLPGDSGSWARMARPARVSRVGSLGGGGAPGLGVGAGAGDRARAVDLHERAAVGLLKERDLDHVNLAFQ